MVEEVIPNTTPSPLILNEKTTIPIKKSTRDELKSFGKKDESYDKLLKRMMSNLTIKKTGDE